MPPSKSEPVVEVDLREVYEHVQALESWVQSADSKLDVLLERSEAQRGTVSDHEDRLRSVERWKWILPPGVLLAGATFAMQFVDAPFGG